MRLWHWLWLPAVVGTFTLLAVACGGDDDASPSPAGSSSPTVTAPPGDSGPGVTDTEIHLGMTSDVDGVGETPYGAVSLAAQAYFAKVNMEDGGVCGRQIVLTVEDDGYSPELALEKTKALVAEQDVLAVIGALSTQAHKAVAEFLNDPNADGDKSDGVPDLFVSTGWSSWGSVETYPWTTGFIPDYRSDGLVLADYIKQHFGSQKVALLYRDDEFGQDYRAALEEAFPDEGSLFAQQYPVDDTDVSEEMGAVVNSAPGVVVLAATPEISADAIIAAAGADFKPQYLLSYVNQPSNLASELGGGTEAEDIIAGFQQLDGVLTTSYLLSAVENENNAAVVEHLRIMETYGGPASSSLSIYGQALAETVVETLDRACPDLTRANVLKAAESLDGYHPSLLLPGVQVALSESDHLAVQALQVMRINADGTLDPQGDAIDVGPQR